MNRILKHGFLIILSLTIILTLFLVLLSLESANYNPIDKTFGKKLNKAAIINARILNTQTGELSNKKTIIINHGLITGIEDQSTSVPEDHFILDASDNVLVHGLADMHAHIFDRAELIQYLSYGVTHVRNMMGFPTHLAWKEEIENNRLTGSRLITASPTLNGTENTSPLHHNIESVQEVSEAIKKFNEQGYDFIKIYDSLTEEQLDAVSEYSSKHGISFSGHPVRNLSNQKIIEAGYSSIEHVEELFQSMLDFEFDTLKAHELVRELKKSEIPVTITLSAYNHLYKTVLEQDSFISTIPVNKISPFIRYLGNKELEGWKSPTQSGYDWTIKKYAFMEYLILLLDKEGVPLLLGTDTGPNLTVAGWSVHQEIGLLQELGISNLKILQSGTTNASDLLNHPSFSGNIELGSLANILILTKNPLEDMTVLKNPEALILEDEYYGKATLSEMREYAENSFSPFLISIGQFINYLFN